MGEICNSFLTLHDSLFHKLYSLEKKPNRDYVVTRKKNNRDYVEPMNFESLKAFTAECHKLGN